MGKQFYGGTAGAISLVFLIAVIEQGAWPAWYAAMCQPLKNRYLSIHRWNGGGYDELSRLRRLGEQGAIVERIDADHAPDGVSFGQEHGHVDAASAAHDLL
jgi:hypothetical protein